MTPSEAFTQWVLSLAVWGAVFVLIPGAIVCVVVSLYRNRRKK